MKIIRTFMESWGPIYLAIVVLLLASGILFHLGVNIWVSIAVGWLGFGIMCYTLFLQICQPTPLISKKREVSSFPKQPPRPPTVRGIVIAVLVAILIAIYAPLSVFLILGVGIHRISVRSKWRQKFPNSTKIEIRDFLDTMVRSFSGYPVDRHYWFRPDEKLIKVYRGFYGPGESPDKEEVEKFAQALKKRYNVDFISLLQEDMTVGELYTLAKSGVRSP